jgi:hypothetical protein
MTAERLIVFTDAVRPPWGSRAGSSDLGHCGDPCRWSAAPGRTGLGGPQRRLVYGLSLARSAHFVGKPMLALWRPQGQRHKDQRMTRHGDGTLFAPTSLIHARWRPVRKLTRHLAPRQQGGNAGRGGLEQGS